MPEITEEQFAAALAEVQGPAPLSTRVRETLSVSPRAQLSDIWRQRKDELAETYGDAQIVADEEGNPIGFQLPKDPRIQSAGVAGAGQQPFLLRAEEDPELQGRIGEAQQVRGDLLAEIEKKGTSLPTMARVKEKAKLTKEGQFSNLEARLGEGRVFPIYDESGNPDRFVGLGENDEVLLSDPQGLADLPRDIAESVSSAPTALGGVAGGLAASSIARRTPIRGTAGSALIQAGVSAGDAAGSLAESAIDEALPGESYPGASRLEKFERARQKAISDVKVGILGEAVSKPLIKVGKWALGRGKARLAKGVRQGREPGAIKEAVEEGKRLEAEVGETLTAEELAGSPVRVFDEGSALQLDSLVGKRAKQLKALGNHISTTFGTVLRGRGSEGIENKAGKALTDFHASLAKARSDQAGPLFDQVGFFAKQAGNESILPINNTLAVFNDTFGGSSFKELLKDATPFERKWIRKLANAKEGPTGELSLSAKDMMEVLSNVSQATVGSGQIFKDVAKAKDLRFAKKLMGALNKDLEYASSLGGTELPTGGFFPGEVSESIIAARAKWAEMSKPMDELQNRLTDEIMKTYEKGFRESLSKKIVSGAFNINELDAGLKVLAKANPIVADELRGRIAGNFMERISTDGAISPAKLVKELGKPETGEIFGTVFKAPEFAARLKTAQRYAERINRAGVVTVASPKSRLAFLSNAPGVAGRAAGLMQNTASQISNPQKLAALLADKEGREIFLGLMKPRISGTEVALETIQRLTTRAAKIIKRNLLDDPEQLQKDVEEDPAANVDIRTFK